MNESRASPSIGHLEALLDGAHLAAPDELAAVVDRAGSLLGWSVRTYLVDYRQRQLVPLPIPGTDTPPEEDVDATLAGRAFRVIEAVPGIDEHLWVPLIDGVERLGVLDIRFSRTTNGDETNGNQHEQHDSARRRAQVRWFAHLVGHLVASKAPYGDSFHLARSARDRSVASELVWSLLPPLTMACEGLIISGLLEPAEQVAGDVFDYAIHGGVADVAIFDATGHDMHSSVIGSLALAAYRNGRRRQQELPAIARLIDSTLIEYGLDTYATGVVGQLDVRSGVFRYVNAGHPSPLLLRNGKVVKSLDGGRRILLGFADRNVEPAEEKLEPDDMIVLYTDGVIEARDHQGEFYGLDRFVEVLERSAADRQQAPETLRRVVHHLLEHQRGILQDDASILVVEWSAERSREMSADSHATSIGGRVGRSDDPRRIVEM